MQIDPHVHDYKHHMFMWTLLNKPWKKRVRSWWRGWQDWKWWPDGCLFLRNSFQKKCENEKRVGFESGLFGCWLKSMVSEAWLLFPRALSPASNFDIWLLSEGGHTAHRTPIRELSSRKSIPFPPFWQLH